LDNFYFRVMASLLERPSLSLKEQLLPFTVDLITIYSHLVLIRVNISLGSETTDVPLSTYTRVISYGF
jgi:hypothetical protein